MMNYLILQGRRLDETWPAPDRLWSRWLPERLALPVRPPIKTPSLLSANKLWHDPILGWFLSGTLGANTRKPDVNGRWHW